MKKIIIIIVVSMLLLSCKSISPTKIERANKAQKQKEEAKKECVADIPDWLSGAWEVYKLRSVGDEVFADYFGEAFFYCKIIELGFITITKDNINKDIKQELDDSILHTKYEIGTDDAERVKKESNREIFVIIEDKLEIEKSTNSHTSTSILYIFIEIKKEKLGMAISSTVNGEVFMENFILHVLE